MITEEQYNQALKNKDDAEEIIQQYHKEEQERFEERMKTNPIFTDDELRYAASERCNCGHGMAYPAKCGIHHYWDCSAILKGIADKNVKHSGRMPFTFYEVKLENENRTTRPEN